MKYYNIDDNLFEISRYKQVDTISRKEFGKINFTTVHNLWDKGEKLFLEVSIKKNKMLETKNEVFEHIFVIEKLQNDKFKRTRVWWIDY